MNLDKINNYLRENLWMDFEVVKIGMNALELHGYADEACDDEIIIRFKSVHMVSLVTHFSYLGEKNFISLITGDKARTININYDVPVGNNIFSLSNTNIASDMIIVATDIEMEVFN